MPESKRAMPEGWDNPEVSNTLLVRLWDWLDKEYNNILTKQNSNLVASKINDALVDAGRAKELKYVEAKLIELHKATKDK